MQSLLLTYPHTKSTPQAPELRFSRGRGLPDTHARPGVLYSTAACQEASFVIHILSRPRRWADKLDSIAHSRTVFGVQCKWKPDHESRGKDVIYLINGDRKLDLWDAALYIGR